MALWPTGSMHQLHNLTVNSSGSYPHVSPYLLSFKGSSLHKEEFSFLTSELSQRLMPYINGDLFDRAITDLNTEVHGDLVEFLLVLDLKSREPRLWP